MGTPLPCSAGWGWTLPAPGPRCAQHAPFLPCLTGGGEAAAPGEPTPAALMGLGRVLGQGWVTHELG